MFHLTWMLIWSIWVIVTCCIHCILKLCIYTNLIDSDVCSPFCSLTFLPIKETIFSHNWWIFRTLKGPSQFYWDYGSFFNFTSISRHHFDLFRTRGPQFCLWLMWPQPVVIAVDCNFPHVWFSQCWDVFCQLHSIGYRNQFLVATLSFHVGS